MAFNDEYSRKDKSNLYRFTNMFMMCGDKIEKYKHGANHVPIVMYDMATTTERDFCDLCRYEFYKKGGLLLSNGIWDSIRGKNFEPQVVKDNNAK